MSHLFHEMVLGDPHGVKPQRLRPLAISELLAHELAIGITAQVLKTRSIAYVHGLCLLRCRRRRKVLGRVANAWFPQCTEYIRLKPAALEALRMRQAGVQFTALGLELEFGLGGDA